MKKVGFWGLLVIVLMLVACNGESEPVARDETYQASAIETEPRNSESELVGDNDFVDDEILDIAPHLVWGSNTTYVVLIDLLTGNELAEFSVESGQMIWNFFDFGKGYFGALISNLTDAGMMWDMNEGTDGATHDEENWRYLIFDTALNIVDEILITDDYLQSMTGHFITYVSYQAGQLMVYYITHLEAQTVYSYNTHTGATEIFLEVDDVTLFFGDIQMISTEYLAFRGTRLGDEVSVYYGFVDLEHHEITVFSESDFRATSSMNGLIVSGSYLLINEEFSAPTMGGGNVLTVDRGEVLVAHAETGNHYVVQLDGMESVWANLSKNGSHVVTVDETGSYFRKYEVVSGNLAYEVRLEVDVPVGWGLEIIPLTENKYAMYFTDENRNHQVVTVEVN